MWLFQIFFSNFRKVFELFLVCKLDKTMLEPDATLVQIKQTATQHQTQWSYYRMAKFKSAESFWCNTSTTSKASKGQWWKWWKPLAESQVWYPKVRSLSSVWLESLQTLFILQFILQLSGEQQRLDWVMMSLWLHCLQLSQSESSLFNCYTISALYSQIHNNKLSVVQC